MGDARQQSDAESLYAQFVEGVAADTLVRRPRSDEDRTQVTVGWPETVPLDVIRWTRPVLERVPALVGDRAGAWLGGTTLTGDPDDRRILCDLELGTGAGDRTLFRKSAIVTLGPPLRRLDGWVVPVEWRAATLMPLFPVFVGYLEVGGDHLSIHGRYAPPGGMIGRALDAAILHVAARATADWFLGRFAAALAGA